MYDFVLQMVFLPEACDYIGESKQQSMDMAESVQGEIINEYKKLAKDLDVWLSVGGFHEKVGTCIIKVSYMKMVTWRFM